MGKYKNFGDVNPIEHGGIFIRKDEVFPESRTYYAVLINKVEDAEDTWLLEDCYIDLDDLNTHDLNNIKETFEEDGITMSDENLVREVTIYSSNITGVVNHIQTIIKGNFSDVTNVLSTYGIIINEDGTFKEEN